MAGRESRDRSVSTELGTAEEARTQALEVPKKFLTSSFFFIFLHVFLGFLLFYFYFIAAGQNRRKGGGDRGSGDRAQQHQGPVQSA